MGLDRCSLACNGSAAIGALGDSCYCLSRAPSAGGLDDYLCHASCSGAESQLCGHPETGRANVYHTPHNLPADSYTVAGAGSDEWNGVYRLTSFTGSLKGERLR